MDTTSLSHTPTSFHYLSPHVPSVLRFFLEWRFLRTGFLSSSSMEHMFSLGPVSVHRSFALLAFRAAVLQAVPPTFAVVFCPYRRCECFRFALLLDLYFVLCLGDLKFSFQPKAQSPRDATKDQTKPAHNIPLAKTDELRAFNVAESLSTQIEFQQRI